MSEKFDSGKQVNRCRDGQHNNG